MPTPKTRLVIEFFSKMVADSAVAGMNSAANILIDNDKRNLYMKKAQDRADESIASVRGTAEYRHASDDEIAAAILGKVDAARERNRKNKNVLGY